MSSITNIVNHALSMLGVYSIGQTPSAEDTNLAKFTLERLFEELTEDKLIIPYETTDTLTLVTGQHSYTIGQSGTPDLNTVRPDSIKKAILRSGSIDYTLDIIALDQYREEPLKSSDSMPYEIAYNPTLPNGVLYFYPTPSQADTVYITSKKPYTTFSDLSDDMTTDLLIPSSYFNFLTYKLALLLSPHYNVEPNVVTLITNLSVSTENKIKNRNAAREIRPVSIPYRGVNVNSRIKDFNTLC